jgi:hypothetical protein
MSLPIRRVTFVPSLEYTRYTCKSVTNTFVLYVVVRQNQLPMMTISTWAGIIDIENEDVPREFSNETFIYVPIPNPLADSFPL